MAELLRRSGDDTSSLLNLKATTHAAGAARSRRHRSEAEDRSISRDADPGRARHPGHGRLRSLPPVLFLEQLSPSFLIEQGAAPRTRPSTTRFRGIRPAHLCAGRAMRELSDYMLRGLMDRSFDMAFSHRAERSTTPSSAQIINQQGHRRTCRWCRSTPTSSRRHCRRPVVFWELGCAIREVIDSYPSDKRIAAIGSGHLSLELGGPRPVPRDWPRSRIRPPGHRVDFHRQHRGDPRERHPRIHGPERQRHPRLHGSDID